ncbi:TetR/AcrR family transcriptional regulator [Nocardia coubleae]|uniref:TetR/AcrR family transcriptional regulator n=1 Tax=Nocardia coubleae TaxID=356147 RepID=A0A846W1I2_9NOCA|nr:TetR-like C-terminal domain-containing protein [Nocardia coubleae]NKX86518.1 TetR/AcrR family transcriptional regulator [Nocardia coubleae]
MDRVPLNRSVVTERAAQLADASGFDSLSLAAVARSFGVRTPSLYSHVEDLADLRDGITALALGELAANIGDAIAGRSKKDALVGFTTAHREYSTEHPGRWASLQRRAGQAAVDSGAARRIVQVTDAVLLGYDIPVPDRVHATRIMASALSGFLNLERSGNFAHSMPPAEQSWPELIDALDFLLAHWHNRGTARERATP